MRNAKSLALTVLGCSAVLLAATVAAGNDDVITAEVRTALIAAVVPAPQQLEVRVFNGEADLSGVVDSADNKAAASRVVGTIKGVTSVRNDLKVREQ